MALFLFPGQRAAKHFLRFRAGTMIFVGDKNLDSDELRDFVESNGGLACISPRLNRTS